MKTIIFDFDGTLADTLAINHQIMNELARKYKFKLLTLEDVKRLKELPAKLVLKFMGIPKYKVPFVMIAGKQRLNDHIDSIPLSDEFRKLLGSLAVNSRLGVVSSNSQRNVLTFLANHKVKPFDFIYADTRLSGKARVLKRAIKKLKLDVQDVVYIGDEIRDIQAAQQVGVTAIAVTWGYNSKASLERHSPTYLVETIVELENALKAFGV